MIQAVLGSIEKDSINNTLSHEHIIFGKAGFINDKVNCYDRNIAYQNAMNHITIAKEYGVNLIVDTTTIEWGRDVLLMKDISENASVHIVCSTGFFKDEGDMLALLKSYSYCDDIRTYCALLFEKEVMKGIGNTSIKAGIIKIGSSLNEIKPLEKEIFQAAAYVSKKYNIPIFTHCERGTMGLEQAKLLSSLGVDPNKIVIGHMTSNRNLDEIEKILTMGFNIAFDQFGIISIPNIPTDEEKMSNLLTLLKKGYQDSIVLSHDVICDRMGYISQSKPRYLDMIYKDVIPYLKENGISSEITKKITRDNLIKILDK